MGEAKAVSTRIMPKFEGEKFTGFFGSILFAILGGQAFVYSFDPYGFWFLLPIAIAMLIFAAYTRSSILSFLNGFIFGASAFMPLFNWAQTYAGLEPWLALALFEALFMAIFAICARQVLIKGGITLRSGIGLAFLWAAVEYLRANYPWGGLPWALSAYAYPNSPLLNFGPWVGITGLAVITGFLGASVFAIWTSLLIRRRRGRNGIFLVWPASIVLLVMLTAMVFPRPTQIYAEEKSYLEIAAIQGNVPRPPDGSYYQPKEMFDNHAAETERFLTEDLQAGSGGFVANPEIILWPEDSAGWNVLDEAARMQRLQALSSQAEAPFLIGAQTSTGENNRYNKAILVDQNGATGQEYIKRHPVPFGEYIPARSFFEQLSDKTALISTDMLPGKDVGIMQVAGTSMGVLICFEIAYDYAVNDAVNAGATILVVQSNTALFGDSNEAIQQLAQAKVQSVISGRTVVHIATVGHSGIFTPDGRENSRLGHWESGTMQARVPLYQHLTPAIKYSNEITTVSVALGILTLVLALFAKARRETR